jgi:photosystem II stability/assembly factor-like uncharacterized protein
MLSAGILLTVKPAAALVISPMDQPALAISDPQDVALIAIAYEAGRLVAVGEHGVIVISEDKGASWHQAASPVSVTLTSVYFVNSTEGFVTGQFGVVLRTQDGGRTWTRVLDGITAAHLAVTAAAQLVAAAPKDPTALAALAEAHRLVAQGPDKPFFDSYFSDAQNGFVIGAYNLIYRTADGGRSWTAWMSHTGNTKRFHLYAIAADGGDIYIAGEQGLVLRSIDGGQSFQQLSTPYAGSFFSVATAPSGEVVIAGLEGNAFRSVDQGVSWQQINGLPPVGIVSVTFGSDQKLWLANQAGQIFWSLDGGKTMSMLPPPPGPQPASPTSILALPSTVQVSTFAGMEEINYSDKKPINGPSSHGS